MSRRRPTLRVYLRRRWRTIGFLVVLFLGALLLLAITDRGHDPLWQLRAPIVEQVDVAPDGRVVYVLAREDAAGRISRLEAHAGAHGGKLWTTDLNETRALLAAGDDGVVLATDFPRAFVTYFGNDGRPRWAVPLEDTPRALAVERGRVAVGLQGASGEDQVLVLEEGRVVRSHAFEGLVTTLDMRAERLVVGTTFGELVLFGGDGEPLRSLRLDVDIQSLRLSADGTRLLLGGAERFGTGLSGVVAFIDYSREEPLQWTQRVEANVGLVDLDDAGERGIAVEESATRHRVHAYETVAARESWRKALTGIVSRDEAGHGGAAISPDGDTVVVGTILGSVRAFDGATGALRWTYDSHGTTTVAFPDTQPPVFVTNARVVPSGPLESVLLFSPTAEPLKGTVAGLAAAAGLLIAAGGVLLLGIGYWRVRRQSA